MKKEEAIAIQRRALGAIRELNSIAALDIDWAGDNTLSQLRKAIGASMWRIDEEILSIIYSLYPDLNDLKELDPGMFDHLFDD